MAWTGPAAAAQREAIQYLADAYGLRNLSPALREAAQLRLSHADETLAELGRRAGLSRPTLIQALRGEAVRPKTAWKIRRALAQAETVEGGC